MRCVYCVVDFLYVRVLSFRWEEKGSHELFFIFELG